jgi:PAS domain S-box-containing protein
MRTTASPTPRVRARLAWWVASYLVVGVVVALLEPDVGQAAWYPPVAIGVAMLFDLGVRTWPVLVLADVAVSLVQYEFDVPPALVSGAVTAVEIVVIFALLRRMRFRRGFDRFDDVVLMGVSGAVGALSAASLGTLLIHAIGDPDDAGWSVWAVGDLTGFTIVFPVVMLALASPGSLRRLFDLPRARLVEFVLGAALSLTLAFAYFVHVDPSAFGVSEAGPMLLCLLPVFWIAVRFDLFRTALFLLVLDITASIGFSGLGPHLFESAESSQSHDMVAVQLPMFAIGLAALGVSAAVAAQQRALLREQATLDASPVAIVALDRGGAVTSWNQAAERIFGYTADEAVGRIPPAVPPTARADFQRHIAHERSAPGDRTVRYHHKDGREIAARMVTAPLHGPMGEELGVISVFEDLTKVLEMQEYQALLNTAFDQTAESIVVTDLEGHIIYVNPAATAVSGYSRDELMSHERSWFQSDVHGKEIDDDIGRTLARGETWSGVVVDRRKNGELLEQQATISPVRDGEGRPIAFVSVLHDLTPQRRMEADIERDRATRTMMAAIMERARSEATLEATASSLCRSVVSVTDFDVAIVFQRHQDGTFESIGEAGPLGARRGRIISPANGAAEMSAITERGPWWTTRASLVAQFDHWDDRFSAEQINAVAFAPMRWNRDMFGVLMLACRSTDDPDGMERQLTLVGEVASFGGVLVGSQVEAEREREGLRAGIREIIDQHAFHPVFQPYVDLATGDVRGYEALTRFDDGTRPDRKIRDAWLAGLGVELEAALATAALDTANRLLPDMSVSVNFSPDTILGGRAAQVVRDSGRDVVIEVTEHMPIDDYPTLRAALLACGKVKVSVDDAGAGFSSLRHILELEPDVVKLDIALIRGIDHDPARQALAAGLSHYARDTGTLLIAEGVETEAEADAVRRLGVHWGQGYYFGRPTRIG